MDNRKFSRRSFVKKTALGAGAVGITSPLASSGAVEENARLPREVYLAGFCSYNLRAETSEEMINIVEGKIQTVFPLQPDVVCFPEIFPFYWAISKRLTVPQQAAYSKVVIERFSNLAEKNNCWVVCPVVTEESGKYYNAAVVIDRKGHYKGEYRKMHPTVDEMRDGISPGPEDPPVFETDFGKIGIQICYDVRWDDGWNKLQEKGAEIIFWPSAFPGGHLLNARAWKHQAVIVSSTFGPNSKIVDITGEELAITGRWQQFWACASVNLERAFLHSWPYVNRYDEMQKRYGRKIRIHHLFDEGNSVIESRSPGVSVKDVLKEFNFKTQAEHVGYADKMQRQAREKGIKSLQ